MMYDVCRCSRCLWNKKEKMLLGKKLMFIALDFDINIHALQATDGNH
jgi:hypothetical protein